MKTLLVAGGLCLAVSAFLNAAVRAAGEPPEIKAEAPLCRDGPRLTVRVVARTEGGGQHYVLHVSTSDGLDQRIPFRNGRPVTANTVRLVDVNADGFLDILVVGGTDHRGAEWFKTWLYDAEGKKFRWINDR